MVNAILSNFKIFSLLNVRVFSVACGKEHSVVLGTARESGASPQF
jgi:hypothetical protein